MEFKSLTIDHIDEMSELLIQRQKIESSKFAVLNHSYLCGTKVKER